MIGDAHELRQHQPHVLRARWRFEAEKFLDRHAVADVVDDRRHVVQPVGERNRLLIRVRLAALFEAAVEISDLLFGADDLFPVERHDDAQRAVRRRMRGAEVEGHALEVSVDVLEARIDFRNELRDVFFRAQPPLRRIVVLAERVTLKRFVRQDAAKVRVTGERHAVHVPRFALEPVEALENRKRRIDRLVFPDANLQSHAFVVCERIQLVNQIESF